MTCQPPWGPCLQCTVVRSAAGAAGGRRVGTRAGRWGASAGGAGSQRLSRSNVLYGGPKFAEVEGPNVYQWQQQQQQQQQDEDRRQQQIQAQQQQNVQGGAQGPPHGNGFGAGPDAMRHMDPRQAAAMAQSLGEFPDELVMQARTGGVTSAGGVASSGGAAAAAASSAAAGSRGRGVRVVGSSSGRSHLSRSLRLSASEYNNAGRAQAEVMLSGGMRQQGSTGRLPSQLAAGKLPAIHQHMPAASGNDGLEQSASGLGQ